MINYLFFYFRNILKTPDGKDTWVLPDQKTGFYDLELQLPSDIKCEQCILQVIRYIIQISSEQENYPCSIFS